METLPTFNFVSIGNGLFARTSAKPSLSLMEQYRRKQAVCEHAKRDPRGTCYTCGHRQVAK